MIVILAGGGLSAGYIINHRMTTNTQTATVTPAYAHVPVHLIIQKIGVDARIEQVGLTSTGAMGAPNGPTDVGWYGLGTSPGQIGSAVIDGHSGWKDGLPAVFDNLHNLHDGDRITVIDGTGTMTTFVVREVRAYASKAAASVVFSSNDGKAHLNLITCEGVWNPITKNYSDRLVIFTDKI